MVNEPLEGPPFREEEYSELAERYRSTGGRTPNGAERATVQARLDRLMSRPGVAAIRAEMDVSDGLSDAEREDVGRRITDEINADLVEAARLRASMEQAKDPSRRHPWVPDE